MFHLLTFPVIYTPFVYAAWLIFVVVKYAATGVNKLEFLGLVALLYIAVQFIKIGRKLLKKYQSQ